MKRTGSTTPSATLAVAALAALAAGATTIAQEPAPPSQTLRLIVRDFRPDHPDFEATPGEGYGHYCGNIDTQLGEDGKPVFTGEGFRVSTEWRDFFGRQIAWCVYDETIDRKEGKGQKGEPDTGGITSAETFNHWFRDYPGTNLSRVVPVEATLGPYGMYRIEDNNFHPIDGSLLGNDTYDENLCFTIEFVANFEYRAGDHQRLRFKGDDDLWVFIDGRLVIDLGGVAGNQEQIITLNRLGLEDGEIYQLHLFQAERHQPKSQFRLATNIIFERDDRAISTTEQFD